METTHSFFDETPTPTRFIRNCEEICLFQDLQHNPFDETFRIALESPGGDLSNVLRESLPKSVTEETLNTPKIITVAKSDNFQNVYSVMEEEDNEDFIIPSDSFLVETIDLESSSACTEKENISHDSGDVEIIEEPIQQNGFSAHTKITQPTTVNTIVSALTSSNPNNITYAISSNTIKNRSIGNFIIQNGPSIPTRNNLFCSSSNNKQLVVQKSVISANKDKSEDMPKLSTPNVIKAITTSKDSDFLYQSSAKLPAVLSGKNVVILPSRGYLTKASASQPIRAAVKTDESPRKKINTGNEVRMKLRNLLKTNSSQLVGDPILREEYKGSLRESSSTNSVIDEKREYSRERNRMAQKRCRMKKKRWIMQMKKETELVLNENQNLQVEVTTLRAEIAHLKTLLLAHRNCSVTRAMYKADLSAIMNSDISKFAENVEILVPDSTDDCDETKINYNTVVSHQQVNQVNHHVNHIHVHVPSSSQPGDDTQESAIVKSRSGHGHEMKLHNSQVTQNRKLIFDSKVVPIKPDDRSASVLHKQINQATVRSNVLTVGNSGRKNGSKTTIDTMPMQSTEVSGSTNSVEHDQNLPKISNVIKWNPIVRAEKVEL